VSAPRLDKHRARICDSMREWIRKAERDPGEWARPMYGAVPHGSAGPTRIETLLAWIFRGDRVRDPEGWVAVDAAVWRRLVTGAAELRGMPATWGRNPEDVGRVVLRAALRLVLLEGRDGMATYFNAARSRAMPAPPAGDVYLIHLPDLWTPLEAIAELLGDMGIAGPDRHKWDVESVATAYLRDEEFIVRALRNRTSGEKGGAR
jgi:hypothetical protein